jgi:hypothetical protein
VPWIQFGCRGIVAKFSFSPCGLPQVSLFLKKKATEESQEVSARELLVLDDVGLLVRITFPGEIDEPVIPWLIYRDAQIR